MTVLSAGIEGGDEPHGELVHRGQDVGRVIVPGIGRVAGSKLIYPHHCINRCEDMIPAECCPECDTSLTIAILPGDTYEYQWDGTVLDYVNDVCEDCSCYRNLDPIAGDHMMYVGAHSSVNCTVEPCVEPDATGELWNTTVQGAVPGHRTCISIRTYSTDWRGRRPGWRAPC